MIDELESIFEKCTEQAVSSRVNQGKKLYNTQSVKSLRFECRDFDSHVSCFVADPKKKAVYSTTCVFKQFSPKLLNRYNQDFKDVLRVKNISVKEILDFENYYRKKFLEESLIDSKEMISEIECDCSGQKKKDYCIHYYALLAALFAEFAEDEYLLPAIRGVKSNFDYKPEVVLCSDKKDIKNDPVLLKNYFGKVISNDIKKKIIKKANQVEKYTKIAYKEFNEDFYKIEDSFKENFSEWVKKY